MNEPSLMNPSLSIIYENSDLLVVNKPAGLVCHPTKGDAYSSLIGRVRLHCDPLTDIHMINRLDRETSGIVLVAKNGETAAKLRRLWETRAVEKEYVAIVHGSPPNPGGVIDAPLGKDEESRVAIKDRVRADGAPARTEFWVEQRIQRQGEAFTQLRIVPRTGRKHQIRIHLAYAGFPIVGDKLYGLDEDFYLALVEDRLTAENRQKLIVPFHALHARKLQFSWEAGVMHFHAPSEAWFSKFAVEQASIEPKMNLLRGQ